MNVDDIELLERSVTLQQSALFLVEAESGERHTEAHHRSLILAWLAGLAGWLAGLDGWLAREQRREKMELKLAFSHAVKSHSHVSRLTAHVSNAAAADAHRPSFKPQARLTDFFFPFSVGCLVSDDTVQPLFRLGKLFISRSGDWDRLLQRESHDPRMKSHAHIDGTVDRDASCCS